MPAVQLCALKSSYPGSLIMPAGKIFDAGKGFGTFMAIQMQVGKDVAGGIKK